MAHAARLNLRMQKELKFLLTDPPPGVSLTPLPEGRSSSQSSLSTIEARVEGPVDTVYSNGVFTIKIQIPERYPFQPPNVTFQTPIYHPNIDNGGRICLDILNLPPKGAWQPSLNISTVLTSIGLLLSEPNPDDGLMCETSREYKYNRQVFDQKARTWTEKYAKAGGCCESTSEATTIVASSSKMKDELMQTGCQNPGMENQESKKRIRVAREKLSLRSVRVDENDINEENMALVPENPRPQDSPVDSAKLESLKSVPTAFKPHSGGLNVSEATDRRREKSVQYSKVIEELIVLDSEDSDDECTDRRRRSRLSQLWKHGGI